MKNTKIIQMLEQVSLNIPDRILKVKGYVHNGDDKQYLEIIIFKGFSSSTTHPIDPDHEKDIIDKNYSLTKCQLLKAPINEKNNKVLKEVDKIELFLNIDYWY